MTKVFSAALIVGLVAAQADCAYGPKKELTEEKPEAAIEAAVKLLEAKDYTGFLMRLMDPDELAEALKGMQLDELAKFEVEYRAEKLLRDFKLLKGTKPELNKEATRAVFRANDPNGKKVEVTFKKVKGSWYVK